MNRFELSRAAGNPLVSILKVNERINLGNTEELKSLAEDAHKHGALGLLLDLSTTPSITSAGLRAVLTIFKLFGGKAFKLVSPAPEVRRTLEIAGFADQIGIFDDLPAALASLQE